MATTNLLTLIDDVATLLDDVATLTKVATKRTAGILGDDLAVNAEQVAGVTADRELPVVWAVAKGSAVNKVILVPAALLLSVVVPGVITPLLMLGGAFLCFEGVEKVLHTLLHPAEADQARHDELLEAVVDTSVDMVEFEAQKIKGAIRTDFILSAEIIVITLGTVAEVDLVTQVATLVVIAGIMTVGVYGLVPAIVKLDDLGLHLSRQAGGAAMLGRGIILAAPWLMKTLGVAGTVAMFLVGGGIILHGTPGLETAIHQALPPDGLLGAVAGLTVNGAAGFVVGLLAVGVTKGLATLRPGRA